MGLTAKTLASALHPFQTKLATYVSLSADDMQALQAVYEDPGDFRGHAPRFNVLDGEPNAVRLITSGWVGVARTLSDGRRQIFSIALAGDVVRGGLGECVFALTQAGSIDAQPLVEGLERAAPSPLTKAWRLAEADQQQRLLDQIVRLGSLTAYERAANLIVELVVRHERVGLGDGRRMPWPITQEVVSDVLGLSIVHVNRVLQQLRRDRLIEIRAGSLIACDLERLAQIGCTFLPTALQWGERRHA